MRSFASASGGGGSSSWNQAPARGWSAYGPCFFLGLGFSFFFFFGAGGGRREGGTV